MNKAEQKARAAIVSAMENLSKAKLELDRALRSLPDKEPGLISLMYWGTHDLFYKKAFHTDTPTWLDRFQIPDGPSDLINEIGESREPQPAKALFDAHLVEELLGIWTATMWSTKTRPPSVPKGLISFIYWMRYNKHFNKAFRSDPRSALDDFNQAAGAAGLPVGAPELIVRIGESHGTPAWDTNAKELFDRYLIAELLQKDDPKFW